MKFILCPGQKKSSGLGFVSVVRKLGEGHEVIV
jgi:hypothetical protein